MVHLSRYALRIGSLVLIGMATASVIKYQQNEAQQRCENVIKRERRGYEEACRERVPFSSIELILRERDSKLRQYRCEELCELWTCATTSICAEENCDIQYIPQFDKVDCPSPQPTVSYRTHKFNESSR